MVCLSERSTTTDLFDSAITGNTASVLSKRLAERLGQFAQLQALCAQVEFAFKIAEEAQNSKLDSCHSFIPVTRKLSNHQASNPTVKNA